MNWQYWTLRAVVRTIVTIFAVGFACLFIGSLVAKFGLGATLVGITLALVVVGGVVFALCVDLDENGDKTMGELAWWLVRKIAPTKRKRKNDEAYYEDD